MTATGTAPLYYQWQKNATNISLATNSTYTIGAVTTNDAGSYRCRVSNVVNAATSSVAVLTVNSAPVFNPLGLQTAVVAVAKTVTVSAAGTPAPVLALQSATASSGYSFTAGTGVLVYTPPVADGGSTRTFTFTASNGLGVATQTVSVVVNEAPPAAPAAIWASVTNATDFTAAWSAVPGATGYRLDAATNATFSGGGGGGGTLLTENFDAWSGTWINGWTHNSGVQYTTGGVGDTPCVGMNAANDWIQAPACTNAGTLSFYVRTSSDPGNWTVVVRTSPDGTNWTDRATLVEDGTGGTINNTPLQTNLVLNLSGLCHIRWAMTARSADSCYIDNVLITGQEAGTPSYVPGYSNLTVAGTSQSVTGLVTGATYYFRARAVSGGGTGTYSAVTSVTTVAKASQTIDFPAIGAQVATQVLALSATASSGLPVAFSVASGPAAITNGSTISFTGAGTVAVVASQAGNAGWNPAPNVTNTFSVIKASAAVTLGNLAQIYDGTARTVSATTEPAGLAVDFTYNGSATVPTNADSYAVTGTVNEALYQGSAAGTLVVARAVATVTLAGLAQTYDGTPKSVTATTGPAGLVVDITYDGLASAPTAAGSYAVTGTVHDLNHAGSTNSTLFVAKADQTITFPAVNTQVATATVALAATASSGLPVEIAVFSGPAVVSGGTNLAFTGAGEVRLVASQAGDANWNPAPDVTHIFSVTKATASVMLEGLAQTYDGAPKSVTATTVPAGLAVDFTYDGLASAPTAAGSYAVTGTVSDANYTGSAAGTLNITNPPTPFEQWLLDRTLDPEDPRYDPAADDDHDGATTEEEYLADTDPALAGSVFVITGAYDIAAVPGGTGEIRMAFPASTARYYQLEYCIDLTNHIIGTSNLGWGVPGMVVTGNAPGTWYGVIRSRLQEPDP